LTNFWETSLNLAKEPNTLTKISVMSLFAFLIYNPSTHDFFLEALILLIASRVLLSHTQIELAVSNLIFLLLSVTLLLITLFFNFI